MDSFPRHRAAASLKLGARRREQALQPAFSAASGRGLIEARSRQPKPRGGREGFPRHRAAASLKPRHTEPRRDAGRSFPRHRAAASLKPLALLTPSRLLLRIFRGIGPRPH